MMASKARLLVVEDSRTHATAIRSFLEKAGFEVELAENGRQGLDMVYANPPDLVVTDLQMPEMNGLQLVEALHNELPRLPVVLVTSKGSEEIAAKALRTGAASYVPKKRLQADLIPTVTRILSVSEAVPSQDRMRQFLTEIETKYLLENDTTIVPSLVAWLQEDLSQLELCDESESMQLAMALDEALTNAIIHGNLEVSSQVREADDGKAYVEQIKHRRSQPPYSERRVSVSMKASRENAIFAIHDEGPGFDVSSIPDPTDSANLEKASGRGLMLINLFMDEVSHNETGNEITMVRFKTK